MQSFEKPDTQNFGDPSISGGECVFHPASTIIKGEQPAGPTILLVDDEPAVADTCRQLLNRLGCNAAVVACGKDALQYLQDKASLVSVVVLDINLPDMDGIQLNNRIYRKYPDLPVIISSGDAYNMDVHALVKKGTVVFISKPYGLGALKTAIEQSVNIKQDTHHESI